MGEAGGEAGSKAGGNAGGNVARTTCCSNAQIFENESAPHGPVPVGIVAQGTGRTLRCFSFHIIFMLVLGFVLFCFSLPLPRRLQLPRRWCLSFYLTGGVEVRGLPVALIYSKPPFGPTAYAV